MHAGREGFYTHSLVGCESLQMQHNIDFTSRFTTTEAEKKKMAQKVIIFHSFILQYMPQETNIMADGTDNHK